jgi:hypothetical protein
MMIFSDGMLRRIGSSLFKTLRFRNSAKDAPYHCLRPLQKDRLPALR